MLKGVAADIVEIGGGRGKGVLIVDDLVDTGKTAKVVRDILPEAHFATVYAKPMGRPLVDTFVTEVSQDTWIYFPWDTGLAFQPPIRDGECEAARPARSARSGETRPRHRDRRRIVMDAVTPQAQKSADQHSHVVRPRQHGMAEDALSRLRGQDAAVRSATGLVTALMRFEPGAILPDHEHVKIEQTYVLEGKLVDKEGPAAGSRSSPANSSGARRAAAMSPGRPRAG